MNCFFTNCIKMKHSNLLKLLSVGMLLGMFACSHDDDEPVNNGTNKEQQGGGEETVDNTAYN